VSHFSLSHSATTSLRSSRPLSPQATPAASVHRLRPSQCTAPAASRSLLKPEPPPPLSLSRTLRCRIHRSRACSLRPAAALVRRRDGSRRIALPRLPRGRPIPLSLPRPAPEARVGADACALLLSFRDGAAGDMAEVHDEAEPLSYGVLHGD
jgi:hypothetical protein